MLDLGEYLVEVSARDEKQNCCPGERKLIGKVTYQERDEILALHERKNGLLELMQSLAASDDELLRNSLFYEKIIADLGTTTTKHQKWWETRAKQYHWEKVCGNVWEIDFETCQIFVCYK